LVGTTVINVVHCSADDAEAWVELLPEHEPFRWSNRLLLFAAFGCVESIGSETLTPDKLSLKYHDFQDGLSLILVS